MKKLIAILFVIVSLNGYSQKVDTIKNSLQIQPIVANVMKGDTAYQLLWRISVERGGGNIGYASMHDRVGNKIYEFNFVVPKSVIDVWLDDSVIDDFILTNNKLKRRQ